MFQNYMSLNSPESGVRSSRLAIKDELAGKLVFDDPRVFNRLGVNQIPTQMIENCSLAFQNDPNLTAARQELEAIVTSAVAKPIEVLEAEDDVHDSYGTTKVKKKVEEKKMYSPLVSFDMMALREMLIVTYRRPYSNLWKTLLPTSARTIRSCLRTRLL